MATKTRNKNLRLAVVSDLLAKIDREMDFLGVSTRSIVVEEREVRNRSELLRAIALSYSNRALDWSTEPRSFDDDVETEYVSFWLNDQTKGLWDAAIRHGAASNYHHLINCAIADYFDRQQAIARQCRTMLISVEQLLRESNIEAAKRLVLYGE